MSERRPVPEDVLQALTDVCGRIIARRVSDVHDREDLVQETVARTLGAKVRLMDEALVPYGATVAVNVCKEHAASRQRDLRNLHRLHEPTASQEPVAALLAAEERNAVLAAVRTLRPEDQMLLVDHVVGGGALANLGKSLDGPRSTAGGQAAKLSRARARARVEYVLAIRGQQLPGEVCKQVLVAVSFADTRRQAALDVPAHLAVCPVCPDLLEPLARRRSGLAAFLPFPLAAGLGRLVTGSRQRSARVTTASAVVVILSATVSAGVVLAHDRDSSAVSSRRVIAPLTSPVPGPDSSLVPALSGSATDRRGTTGNSAPGPAAATTSSTGDRPAGGLQASASGLTSPPVSPLLGDCYFDDASDELDAECLATMAAAARRILDAGVPAVIVTGMTDETGFTAANGHLAAARANAVASRLRLLLTRRVSVSTVAVVRSGALGGDADRRERRATIRVSG